MTEILGSKVLAEYLKGKTGYLPHPYLSSFTFQIYCGLHF
jgi:hypothetical protein